MVDYDKRMFPIPWLDKGRVRKYVEENRTSLSLLKETFTAFQNDDVYKMIIMAMKDWNDWIDAQWSGLDAEAPGFRVKMGQLQAMRRYMSWFQKLIVDLKGLAEAPADGEDNRPDTIENYV